MSGDTIVMIDEIQVNQQLQQANRHVDYIQYLQYQAAKAKQLEVSNFMPAEMVGQHSYLQHKAELNNIDIPFLGATVTLSEPRLLRGKSSDWAIMSLNQDPLYIANNSKMILPQSVYRHLKSITKAGIDFDLLTVAHELPAGVIEDGKPIPIEYLVPPAPPGKVARIQKLSKLSQRYWKAAGAAMITAGIGTAIVATAAISMPVLAVGAAASLASGLDPILFGMKVDYSRQINGQHPALVYVLAQWAWPESR